ncbi:MAG: hypothetical protein ACOC2C_06690 [Cyclonatronaceae bacterium]
MSLDSFQNLQQRCFDLIVQTARIPSFSSYEERLHPFIKRVAAALPGVTLEVIEKRNLLLRLPAGDASRGRIALSAHLDKINHFGEQPPEELPCRETDTFIEGQMDNTAGLGIILSLLEEAAAQENYDGPELLLLLSEMEESTGLRQHPHLLRNGGEGLHHGLGAERLSHHLLHENLIPDLVLTVDTTPLFKGEPGAAVYSGHWKFTKTQPAARERALTDAAVKRLLELDPKLLRSNNTNDYLIYGKLLNADTKALHAVPSLAVEPAIYPYHTKNERVFKKDIARVLRLLHRFIHSYNGVE